MAALLNVNLSWGPFGVSGADGTVMLMGASMWIATALAPRLRDYAVCLVLHFVACIVALNVRVVATTTGLILNFAIITVIAIAVAYKSERQRREALLLAWWLRRSNIAVALAGARPQTVCAPLTSFCWEQFICVDLLLSLALRSYSILCCVRGLQRRPRRWRARRLWTRTPRETVSSAPSRTSVMRFAARWLVHAGAARTGTHLQRMFNHA